MAGKGISDVAAKRMVAFEGAACRAHALRSNASFAAQRLREAARDFALAARNISGGYCLKGAQGLAQGLGRIETARRLAEGALRTLDEIRGI